ncbi:hypothetical protein, partial [Romboutsia sp. 13368]
MLSFVGLLALVIKTALQD